MADLLVIVPSRGRPESVRRVVRAWLDTDAYADAELVFVIDADDPEHSGYFRDDLPDGDGRMLVQISTDDRWRPMVHKLDRAAYLAATGVPGWKAIAFMGDDQLPRTPGWARSYLNALQELGTGIVFGDDLLQGERLPTQWAMTADIVTALGRMVPADVEHLYSDNSILDLGQAAGCIRHLPHVVIEHAHPIAGRAEWDDQYRQVNDPRQYARDRAAYMDWHVNGMQRDAATVRALREVNHGVGAGVRADL